MSPFLQKALDEHLNTLLSEAPRRSVLMVDSGKESEDGGYVSLVVANVCTCCGLHN